MDISYSDIRDFCETLAETHPLILHNAASPATNRFYGYNETQLLSKERTALNFDTLILGLALPGSPAITWNYQDTGTSILKQKYFEIVVLGKFNTKDFDAEDTICQNAEQVLDDILSFLQRLDAGEERCDYPLTEYIQLKNITCRRVSNVGIAALSGAVMRVPLHDFVNYDSATNPFEILIS